MKNAINYYYNLNPDNIHQTDKNVKFSIGDNHYVLVLIDNNDININNLYELSIKLFERQIYCHQFVPNINKSIITNINGNNYVLLIVFINNYNKVELKDLIDFNNITIDPNLKLKGNNWFKLWTEKIDYFEYQISQFGKQFPIIRESFNYFIGLAETAILFFKMTYQEKNNKLSICHRRVRYDDTFFDLYNPLNFTVDLYVRDVAEYFKDKFFNNSVDIYDEVVNYIELIKFDQNDCIMFFSRLLFPSFYFDIYERIINDGEDEKKLLPVITKVKDYEIFLKNIYLYINNFIRLPDIEWLKKV